MSTIDTYAQTMRQMQEAVTDMAKGWLGPASAVFSSPPTSGYGLVDPSEAYGQMTRLTERLVSINTEYFQDLAGAVSKHLAGLASVFKDEIVTGVTLISDQAEKVEDAAVEQANEIERAQRAEARRVKKAARDAAAERYQEMTKVELSEQLAARDLPKTGNVDELRERLIDADLQDA